MKIGEKVKCTVIDKSLPIILTISEPECDDIKLIT